MRKEQQIIISINIFKNYSIVTRLFKEIYDIKVTDELILVYISDKNAIVIPKRAFKTKEASYNFTAKLLLPIIYLLYYLDYLL